MNDEKYEIIEIIDNLDEITEDIYNDLICKYNKQLVDTVIESQIDEDNLEKYQYFLDKRVEECEINYCDSYNRYISDLKKYNKFDDADNNKYFNMISEVKEELNDILSLYNLSSGKISILDKINLVIKDEKNCDNLVRIKELASRYIDLRNKIILGNLRLVLIMTRPYFSETEDYLELIQSGNEGLIKAIDKYDNNKGAKFSTYACYWIKSEIIYFLKRKNTFFTAHGRILDYHSIMNKTEKELTVKLGRKPSDLEIAKELGTSINKIKKMKYIFKEPLPLSDLVDLENNDDLSLECLIDDESDVSELYIKKEMKLEIYKKMRRYLTDIEYFVLVNRYGLGDNDIVIYQELGNLLEMSRSNVQLIEKRALTKLKNKCGNLAIYL